MTVFRSIANTSPAFQLSPGRDTATASSESSSPRLRILPTFSSRVDAGAGGGIVTVSSKSFVFLT